MTTLYSFISIIIKENNKKLRENKMEKGNLPFYVGEALLRELNKGERKGRGGHFVWLP